MILMNADKNILANEAKKEENMNIYIRKKHEYIDNVKIKIERIFFLF